MSRFVRYILVPLLVIGGVGLWWVLTPSSPYPNNQSVQGLEDTVSIKWARQEMALIDARGSRDALTALGYVHGMTRGWTVTLWRQTALGQLHTWFGEGVLPLDRHTRRLGLARHAKRSYRDLPDSVQEQLKAYARGMTRALQSEPVRDQDPFVLFNVTPNEWAPWHTLAIERLLAWTATGRTAPPAHAPNEVHQFYEQNRKLHQWLHLHGWNRSVTWGLRGQPSSDSTQAALFHRFVSGASAEPVVQEVLVRRPNAPSLAAASLPGVPLFITGTTDRRSWSALLNSNARIQKRPLDSLSISEQFERLDPPQGDEQLLTIRRLERDVVLAVDTASGHHNRRAASDTGRVRDSLHTMPDTAWTLQWAGLRRSSDISAWLHRAGLSSVRRDAPAFHLFEADGLSLSGDSSWSVLGSPSVVVRDSNRQHIVVGESTWARYHAKSLSWNQQRSASTDLRRWSASDSSTWASQLIPPIDTILAFPTERTRLVREAASYLRNWTYSYEPSSIAATIFDEWMRNYRADLGRVPAPADTNVYFSTYRQRRALLRALDTLSTRFGTDVRSWRWERAVPDRRYFPVWSADSLINEDLSTLGSTQYAPIQRMGQGHPSALSGGRSLVTSSPTRPSGTTMWSGWTSQNGETLIVRRHHYDPTALFARSYVKESRPTPIRLSEDSSRYSTLLVPAPNN